MFQCGAISGYFAKWGSKVHICVQHLLPFVMDLPNRKEREGMALYCHLLSAAYGGRGERGDYTVVQVSLYSFFFFFLQ